MSSEAEKEELELVQERNPDWMEADQYSSEGALQENEAEKAISDRLYCEAQLEYWQRLYPLRIRNIKQIVETVCEEADYPGSILQDEYPDKIQMQLLFQRSFPAIEAAYRSMEQRAQEEMELLEGMAVEDRRRQLQQAGSSCKGIGGPCRPNGPYPPRPPHGSGPRPPYGPGSGPRPPHGSGPRPPYDPGSGPRPPYGPGSGPRPPYDPGPGPRPPYGPGSGPRPSYGPGPGPRPPYGPGSGSRPPYGFAPSSRLPFGPGVARSSESVVHAQLGEMDEETRWLQWETDTRLEYEGGNGTVQDRAVQDRAVRDRTEEWLQPEMEGWNFSGNECDCPECREWFAEIAQTLWYQEIQKRRGWCRK